MQNKICAKCNENIDENNEKFSMIITKKANKILEFEAFHFKCWKDFLEENLRLLINKKTIEMQ